MTILREPLDLILSIFGFIVFHSLINISRLRNKLQAAMRRAVAARLTTWRAPRFSTLPPLMRLSGHNPSQERGRSSCLEDPYFTAMVTGALTCPASAIDNTTAAPGVIPWGTLAFT
jgi:hypothetical protein